MNDQNTEPTPRHEAAWDEAAWDRLDCWREDNHWHHREHEREDVAEWIEDQRTAALVDWLRRNYPAPHGDMWGAFSGYDM
jgi:hypothetical protein